MNELIDEGQKNYKQKMLARCAKSQARLSFKGRAAAVATNANQRQTSAKQQQMDISAEPAGNSAKH